MKKIEDYIRDLVGPSYKVTDPVYQSNDWWICYENEYIYVVFVNDLGQYEKVYENCVVYHKKTVGSRKYEFEKVGSWDFLVPTANSALNWMCFKGHVLERRSTSDGFKASQKFSTDASTEFEVALECIPYVLGKIKKPEKPMYDSEDIKHEMIASTFDESIEYPLIKFHGKI